MPNKPEKDRKFVVKIGVLSDIHGHKLAACKAIEELRYLGAEKLYFLGDAIGYIPDPQVINVLKNEVDICLLGNHELMFLEKCQQSIITSCETDVYRFSLLSDLINSEQLSILSSWPSHHYERIDDKSLMFVHGSPTNPSFGYVYPDTDLTQFSQINADVIFMGHTHYPMVRKENSILFLNPGSVGLPRGNQNFGSALVYDTKSGEMEFIWIDISVSSLAILETYDIAPSVSKILKRCVESGQKKI